MASTTETRPTSGSTDLIQILFRVGAMASLVVLLWQFVTAGEIVGRHGGGALHYVGAIVLHVVTGLTFLIAVAGWRLRGHPVWVTVTAAVVFVLTFVQATVGEDHLFTVHVPGAMILTVGVMILAVWSFRPAAVR